MKINSILTTKSSDVITVRPKASISEGIRLLVKHNIGALVVTDDSGGVVGIISERDIIIHASGSSDLFSRLIEEVMTRQVISATSDDEVMSIAHLMTEKRFRHVPIIEKGELVGIVSIGDILKAQRDKYRGEIDTLETQLMAEDK